MDTLILFGWIEGVGLSPVASTLRLNGTLQSLAMPSWVKYSLPDALWLFSFTYLTLLIWNFKITKHSAPWIFLAPVLGIGCEICQLFGIIPGTFDMVDLLLLIMASLLPFYKIIILKISLMKNKKLVFHALSALVVAFFVVTAVGSGSDSSTPAVEVKHTPEQLLTYLKENVTLKDGMSMEVSEFSSTNCRIRVTVPNEIGLQGADVLGTGVCTLVAKWLSENDYNLELGGIHTSCYVYSPHKGVTGKEGMVVSWGHAYYDSNTDMVEWKWNKSN